jgi:magnesium-transporting ATPase (P-type)
MSQTAPAARPAVHPPTRGAALLARTWGFLGLISATLIMVGFFLTLRHGGWYPGAATKPGSPLNHVYRQATTVAWLGIVACQIGTAFAVRTDHASLRSIGVFSNRFLLAAIAFELAFAAILIYLPAMQGVFGTAALAPAQIATVAPFPFIVWGADELRRWLLRSYRDRSPMRRGPSALARWVRPQECESSRPASGLFGWRAGPKGGGLCASPGETDWPRCWWPQRPCCTPCGRQAP